jgi:hypothetical protein
VKIRLSAVLTAIFILAVSNTVLWAAAVVPSPIAFVGTDDNIYYCQGDCATPKCLTCPAQGLEVRAHGLVDAVFPVAEQGPAHYNWPTYSPDGTKLAYISTSRDESGRPVFGVHVFDFKTKLATRIFESPGERPIYLFWLADSRKLSFLLAGSQGLSLMLAEVREGAPIRFVAKGVPLYFDWNQARHKLLVHTNTTAGAAAEQVYLMSLSEDGQTVDKVLSLGDAPFKAPAWSRDGKHMAYVARTGGRARLYVADAEGGNPRAMVSLPDGESSFVWALDSRHIAYSTAPADDALTYDGIGTLDTASGAVTKLVKQQVAAFYFSPDSHHLAFIEIPAGRPYYSWNVVDLPSAKSRRLLEFFTTRDEALAYRYFDQLALSHSIWSPQSDALVFAGAVVGMAGTVPHLFSPPPAVWVVPITKERPRKIADGKLAFWSPVAGN